MVEGPEETGMKSAKDKVIFDRLVDMTAEGKTADRLSSKYERQNNGQNH